MIPAAISPATAGGTSPVASRITISASAASTILDPGPIGTA